MPVSIPAHADLVKNWLDELTNQLPDADTSPDSDNFVRANATSSVVQGLYQYTGWVLRQAFPDTADSDWLGMHARLRGLTKKAAAAAAGNVTLTGTPKTAFATGLAFRVKGNSTLYQTTTAGVLDASGHATVSAKATLPGTGGNLPAGIAATLVSAPAGLDSTVTAGVMTGGTDTETDGELLARLLDVMRQPAAGGNAHDYKVWAMSVEGVSGAWVFPLRRGLGTVDVVITAAHGLPSQVTLDAVQHYIDTVRPVTAKDFKALAPTEKALDVTVAVGISDKTTMAAVTTAITDSLQTWFAALIPGQEAIVTQIGALISDTEGVLDYRISTPTANLLPVVSATVVEWVRPGKITITPLQAEGQTS
ncbi:baseplate J/gp47 family protein [Cedecea sp. NFIX57]|uniref:baseplate J/gp47 family protein n=1 Tax=Cedecea sp. NFIX57 TaxID=1566286 RepID=UPI000A0CF671|nr:baseplate J/gp47 family protein [Cedecea sp. NFIX57]SMG61879.1 Uncharacterized phage protein gp47/JayE [Cedecea sp. NFIX57]